MFRIYEYKLYLDYQYRYDKLYIIVLPKLLRKQSKTVDGRATISGVIYIVIPGIIYLMMSEMIYLSVLIYAGVSSGMMEVYLMERILLSGAFSLMSSPQDLE